MKYFIKFLVFVLLIYLSNCSEFVPVYIVDSQNSPQHSPTLHKISTESFKEVILQLGKRHTKKPHVLVCIEETLSPEDFSHRDENGKLAFPILSSYEKTAYFPYVQSPLKVLSVDDLKNNFETVSVLDLNDAKDGEHRYDMLERHDSLIDELLRQAKENHDNFLIIYTARHTSWVAAENSHLKTRRSLLAEDEEINSSFHNDTNILIYTSGVATNSTDIQKVTFDTSSRNGDQIIIKAHWKDQTVQFTFDVTPSNYWILTNMTRDETQISVNQIYAPLSFSYHCSDQSLGDGFILKDFQVQPLFNGSDNINKFSDAYDCVGFTSVPIWSGLFVTFILLLIMTFGLTMMVDIKTMDRFDDAKGKTITINASE